ncbi:MAG: TonB family protein [Acidobacteria bacterium]|nr:TonB family protein [Acidobacteriota bacterium]
MPISLFARSLFKLCIAFVLLLAAASIGQAAPQNTVPAAPKIVRKSGGVLAGSAIRRVEPTYPPLAKAARVSGAVVVEVTVDEVGKVIAARALSGHPLLKDAAVAAARGWEFTPTQLGGAVVKVVGTITFNFTLPPDPTSDTRSLEEAQEAARLNPNSAEAHQRLGEEYMKIGRYEDAINSFRDALRLKPDYQEAYRELAAAYTRLGSFDEAIMIFEQALEKFPNDTDLLEEMGHLLESRQRYAKSAAVFKKLTELEPENQQMFYRLGYNQQMLNRHEEAIQSFAQAIQLDANFTRAYHGLGWSHQSLGHKAEAIAAYQQALSIKAPYDRLAVIHENLGRIYRSMNRPDQAMEELKKAVEIDPYRDPAYCLLGEAYLNLSRLNEAVEALQKGVELNPINCCSMNYLGMAYIKLGRLPEAETILRRAIEVSPEVPDGYMNLAVALQMKQQGDSAEAILKLALNNTPKNWRTLDYVAAFYSERGKLAEAETLYREALKLEPNNVLLLNNLGYNLVENNRNLEEALAMIQKAVAAEPNNASYLDSLGWAYCKLGKFAEAELYLKKAAEALGDVAEIEEHFGDLYQRQGKTNQAIAAWQKALSLPTSPQVKERIQAKLNAEKKKSENKE